MSLLTPMLWQASHPDAPKYLRLLSFGRMTLRNSLTPHTLVPVIAKQLVCWGCSCRWATDPGLNRSRADGQALATRPANGDRSGSEQCNTPGNRKS